MVIIVLVVDAASVLIFVVLVINIVVVVIIFVIIFVTILVIIAIIAIIIIAVIIAIIVGSLFFSRCLLCVVWSAQCCVIKVILTHVSFRQSSCIMCFCALCGSFLVYFIIDHLFFSKWIAKNHGGCCVYAIFLDGAACVLIQDTSVSEIRAKIM